MRWILAFVALLTAPALAQEMPTDEQIAWLKDHALNGFDIWPDGTWVTAGESTTGTAYGLRLVDLMSQTTNFRTVWVRADHSNDKSVPYRTTKMKVTFDCAGGRYTIGTTISYNANGSVYPTRYSPSETFDAVPGSTGETWLNLACWR